MHISLGRIFSAFITQRDLKETILLFAHPLESAVFVFPVQVSLPGLQPFFFNLSYCSKKIKRERCTISKAPGFWECEEDNIYLFFPFSSYTVPVTFQTVCPWELPWKMVPSPGNGALWCQSAHCAPPSWAVFQGGRQNFTWGRGYLHSYLPLSRGLSVCKRLLSRLFQEKKKILFLLPGLFFSEKRTLNQIELETHRTEKQSFPTQYNNYSFIQ